MDEKKNGIITEGASVTIILWVDAKIRYKNIDSETNIKDCDPLRRVANRKKKNMSKRIINILEDQLVKHSSLLLIKK